MSFKDFLVSRFQLFFFLVTMILLTQVVMGNIIEPERTLYYKDFIGTFLMAGLCVLPTFITYSKKEPTFKQAMIKQAVQLVLVEGIMLFLSINGIEDSTEKTISVIMICVVTAVIYALAFLFMWYRQYRESQKLTELLKNLQKN